MRGRLASRAHSFKENFLNVFGASLYHHQQQQSPQLNHVLEDEAPTAVANAATSTTADRSDKAIKKKTNSTDNIIDYVSANAVADPRSTEAMVREVNVALRYFQDAVAKGTYQMLPGCATVVLETVLALQSYATSRRDPRRKKASFFAEDGRIAASTKSMCTAVAKLTQWADRVIMDGCVDPTEDYANLIIDPVRVAVNALASNLLAVSVVVPRSTSLHNSLPDLASPDREEKKLMSAGFVTTSADSGRERGRPPPLPPKSKSQSHSDDSVDHAEVSGPSANVDWFSNPLFERRSVRSRSKKHRSANSSRQGGGSESSSFENTSKATTTSSELDTTLPDFCKPQRMSVCEQTSVSYIDVSPNMSRDSFDFDHLIGPLATSSPRATATASASASASFSNKDQYPDNTSSSTSSDIPPALPRKARQVVVPPPPLPPMVNASRKISTYDNVAMPQSASAAFPTFRAYQRSLTSDSSDAEALLGEAAAAVVATPMPPPLPPKKKHIMSYMEMFGRSLVTTDEELVQSLTRTKDLLEAVWQQNYHDYSYNSPHYDMSSPGGFRGNSSSQGGVRGQQIRNNDLAQSPATAFQFSGMGVRPLLKTSHSSYLLPPPELPPPLPPPLLIAAQTSGMPPPFPNLPDDDEEDIQGDMDDDDEPTDDTYPPALPPKRGPMLSSSRSPSIAPAPPLPPQRSSSNEERIIPILIEGRASQRSQGRPPPPQRQESTSSACDSLDQQQNLQQQHQQLPRGHHHNRHRFSADSMTSSTSSSGLGTDIHSLRHSLPSPVMESSQIVSEIGGEAGSSVSTASTVLSKQPSRKCKVKETSPQSMSMKAKRSSSKKKKNAGTSVSGLSVLDQVDVRKGCLDMLVYTVSTTTSEDGKGGGRGGGTGNKELLRAGSVDALIVLATQSVKNDFLYQEAFMATYRTFISTHDLLEKLVQRFRKFNNRRDDRAQQQMAHKRVAHCAFSLMVRVVDGLADSDFQDTHVMELLTDFMAELVNDGELILARALRTKFIEKFEDRKLRMLPDLDTSALNSMMLSNTSKPLSLLNFKSVELAEQMTLLDAQLFLRLDSAELILFVQEQNEDRSPNLTKFTEHFNNMSFWCRTKILQQDDPKERERLATKFIKIMKELRKHNNFNSYLALLSALDSAPVRRLEWAKSITDALKEHCALIDSSSSFRAYRQALSSAAPPCIPYVGLVLQDLTFVHIGNPDTFDGKVNFAKRWQQFNILDNLMRFKKKTYPFERKEEIIHFFGDFVDYWSEDQMWAISETIKPRGRRKDGAR